MIDAKLDRRINSVVGNGNCTGCVACCLLDSGLKMELNENGYYRPIRVSTGAPGALEAEFDLICPGIEVLAQHPDGAVRQRLSCSSFGTWQAWATNDLIRTQGSSGGIITAIVTWLLQTNGITQVFISSMDAKEPRRTIPITLTTAREALTTAGSRYAPVFNAVRAVGESADIVAADYSETGKNGYPSFVERDGVIALIACTDRRLDVITRAFAEQSIKDSTLNLDGLANVQPTQTEWLETLLARVAGALFAGRNIRFKGFRFWRITRGRPRMLLQVVRGSRRRASGRWANV